MAETQQPAYFVQLLVVYAVNFEVGFGFGSGFGSGVGSGFGFGQDTAVLYEWTTP